MRHRKSNGSVATTSRQRKSFERERERERDLESASGEFDADGGLGFEAELVSGESGEEIGFADP